MFDILEKPIPKPKLDPVKYVITRVYECLVESYLALKFLEQGFSRNAAAKIFQAWKALIASILTIEKDLIIQKLKSENERKWFENIAIIRVPTTKLRLLSKLIEQIGLKEFDYYTLIALSIHDYQYHGPDPDLTLSKYTKREEAIHDISLLLKKIIETIENYIRLKIDKYWLEEFNKILNDIKLMLSKFT